MQLWILFGTLCFAWADLSKLALTVSDREAQIQQIKPNQEKTILWKNPLNPEKTKYSFVYLHGFSASRKEISPTVENLAQEYAGGSNAFFTRLTGHGINDPGALRDVTVEDWQADVQESIDIGRQIGDQVVVVATSTSAALALTSLKNENKNVRALILMSPNFGLPRWDSEILLWPGARYWVEWIMGSFREWEPLNNQQQEFWTTKYPYRSTVEVMKAVQTFRKSDLRQFPVPVLVFYNPKDQVVDSEQILSGFDRIQSPIKKIIPVTAAGNDHILAGDILSPQTTLYVVDQIKSFLISL